MHPLSLEFVRNRVRGKLLRKRVVWGWFTSRSKTNFGKFPQVKSKLIKRILQRIICKEDNLLLGIRRESDRKKKEVKKEGGKKVQKKGERRVKSF